MFGINSSAFKSWPTWAFKWNFIQCPFETWKSHRLIIDFTHLITSLQCYSPWIKVRLLCSNTPTWPTAKAKWALTVLSVQQHFKAVGLVVVERLPDFVDGLLVRELSVHETGKKWSRVKEERTRHHADPHVLLGFIYSFIHLMSFRTLCKHYGY